MSNRNIALDIDYREQHIIDLLKKKKLYVNEELADETVSPQNNVLNNKININIKNLIIGDFIFREYTDSNSTQEDKSEYSDTVHYIIERKTINDLCSSIKDGRFIEQKSRLKDTINDPSKIIYIIEGNISNISPMYNIPKTSINSAIQNLIFKHKYKVIFTDSIEETIDNLTLLYKKLVNNDFESKATSVKFIKRADKINQNVFVNMLCTIPGISLKTARMITNQYKSMSDLIQAYTIIPDYESKCSLLSNILLSEKRKIGISLSTKIYKSLFENRIVQTSKTDKQDNESTQIEKSDSNNKDVCLI